MKDLCEKVLDGAVLLTVNQRLARHRSRQYQRWQQESGKLWWETPDILPFRSWLRQLHNQFLISGQSEKCLYPDLLQQRAWQNIIDNDDSVTLLDMDAAAVGARRAWDIACAWHCHPLDEDYLPVDQFVWKRWRTSYTYLLEELGVIDEASLADHLAGIIQAGGADLSLPEIIVLDGFLQLPPQLQNVVDVLVEAGVKVEAINASPDAFVHRCSYIDDSQELLSIASFMRQELERDPSQSLGLVVPDLQNKRADVLRYFDQIFFPGLSPTEIREYGRPYDLSLGSPLSDVAPVHAALLILKLCVTKVRGSEISAVLLSPYFMGGAISVHRREQMDKSLREQRVRSLNLDQLGDQLSQDGKYKLPNSLSRLFKTRKLSRATLSVWAKRFSDWLSLLSWPGSGMDTEEYQSVTAWMECLDDMQLLDDNSGVSATDALAVLSRLARERIFQPDTPATPIQIMGRLESHGIRFDCLWVAGLDTEQWPQTGSPTPFLSIAQQKEAGVPDASAPARLHLAEIEFRQWGSQSPLLIASSALSREGKELEAALLPVFTAAEDNQAIAASYIERLSQQALSPSPIEQLRQSLRLESIHDIYGPALPSGSAMKGGSRLFENQALCPFKCFALHRLSIRPLEEAGLGLDPRQHGTLLHHTLELFWQEIKTSEALHALSEDEFPEVLYQVIDVALDEMQVSGALRDLERQRLFNLLSDWCQQLEAPRENFEVHALEQKLVIEHGGIQMNVTIDRIDKVDDALVVIDYKTGTSNSVGSWADTRISNPQLPLYVLSNDDIEGVAFAQVARNQLGFKGVTAQPNMLPKVKTTVTKSRNGQATERELNSWGDWRLHWKEALDNVAGEIRQGLASVTPMKTACTYCELSSLCRIDEVELAGDDDTTGGDA